MWFLKFLVWVFLIIIFGGFFLAFIGMGISMFRVTKYNEWVRKQNEKIFKQDSDN